MDTDEHTPIERHNVYVRLAKVVIGPLMAALVSIAVAYIQRSSDKAATRAADQTILETTTKTTTGVVGELTTLKTQMATVASATKATGELAVESHEDAPRPKRRRSPSDPTLIERVKKNVVALKDVEAKAKLPVSVPVPPPTLTEPGAGSPVGGGGGATPNPSRGARE